jgi:AraC-like DNA-binding protein
MSDTSELGIVYTEHSSVIATTLLSSLWSYEMRSRGRHRRSVTLNADGNHEFWLDRWDPLLNTILPSTHVSLIINFADAWATGRSLATSAALPRVCVVGPFTQARILRVGRSVDAIGGIVSPTVTPSVFGVPASELVDRIVPLEDLWPRDDVERLFASLLLLERRHRVSALKDEFAIRDRITSLEPMAQTAARLIRRHAGGVSIHKMARNQGLTRQQFARRFSASAGLPPKLFARITRFQALVRVLLSTDVARWASMASAIGYYDQAHMINEFRAFAGSSPTVFFQPHGGTVEAANVQLQGRPCEWVRADPDHFNSGLV